MVEIILASASPRRRELLANLGLKFGVVVPDVDEAILPGEEPGPMVKRVALLKARKVGSKLSDSIVLAADTTVALSRGDSWEILGKPADALEAEAMLSKLSGQTHCVFTGYAVVNIDKSHEVTGVVQTQVTFDTLSPQEIREYVVTGEPMDKAGAYGIQGFGSRLVKSISGSYSNVVGLPLCEVVRELEKLGVKI
jgi:septum formation protein